MQVPFSVEESYDSARLVAETLQRTVSPRMSRLCREEHWLFDERIKSLESCLSKLEAGSPPLNSLHDLYATTVVVPTQGEIDAALVLLREAFETETKPARTTSADSFLYDDVHLVAWLGDRVSPRGVHPSVLNMKFEIQVKTGLQFAWWRATHDQIYKSPNSASHQWAVQRASGQAKAALELLDAVLSDLPRAGALQRPAPFPDEYRNDPEQWLALWRPADRPIDVHRFCMTTMKWVDACALIPTDVLEELEKDAYRELISDRSVTPSQVILVCLHSLLGNALADRLQSAGIKVLVTPELLRRFPDLEMLPRNL